MNSRFPLSRNRSRIPIGVTSHEVSGGGVLFRTTVYDPPKKKEDAAEAERYDHKARGASADILDSPALTLHVSRRMRLKL
jgi:hypothetical protein